MPSSTIDVANPILTGMVSMALRAIVELIRLCPVFAADAHPESPIRRTRV